MDENLKDILSHLNPDVDQEMLLNYLQGKLSAEQQHEVEKKLLEDEFESEALEGLESIRDKKKLTFVVEQLNRDLRKKTEKKKQLWDKRHFRLESWLIILIIVVLFLVVISYLVIHASLNP